VEGLIDESYGSIHMKQMAKILCVLLLASTSHGCSTNGIQSSGTQNKAVGSVMVPGDVQASLDRLASAENDHYSSLRRPPGNDRNDPDRAEHERAERARQDKEISDLRKQVEVDVSAAGERAIPALLSHLGDRYDSGLCQNQLAQIGPVGATQCVDWLKQHPQDLDKLTSVFQAQGKSAGDKLVAMLKGSGYERALAAKALAVRGGNRYFRADGTTSKLMSTSSQKILFEAINNEKDEAVKTYLITALRNFEYGTEESQKDLNKLIESDPSEDIRSAAIKTAAAWAVKTSPGARAEMISAISKALSSDDSGDVRKEAAIALKAAKVNTPEVLAALRKARNDQSNDVRNSALETLGELAAESPESSGANLADIIEELKNPDTVYAGLSAVAKAGPRAKAAVPYILKADAANRKELVIRALAATQSTSPEVVQRMVDALDSNDDIRSLSSNRQAIEYFQNLDAKTAAPAIPILEKIAANARGINKYAAKKCLEKLGVTE
jgi:HEAT repeat protein